MPAGLVADPLAALGGSLSTTGYSSPPVASSGANISGTPFPWDDFNPFCDAVRDVAQRRRSAFWSEPGRRWPTRWRRGCFRVRRLHRQLTRCFRMLGFDRVGDPLHAPLSQARDGNSDLQRCWGQPMAIAIRWLFRQPGCRAHAPTMRDDSLELARPSRRLCLHADPLAAFQQAAPTPVVVDPFAGLMASPSANWRRFRLCRDPPPQ